MKHKHHKIIFKNGQRIRTNKLIEYTIEEHANEHKRLYMKYGHWKDKLAWKGLSGQIDKEEIIKEIYKNRTPAMLGKQQSDYQKERTRQSNKGRIFTKEHRQRISESMIGRKQSDNQKKIVSIKLAKEYIIETPNGTKYNIRNLRKFAISKQLDQGNLTKVAQGKLMSHKGYKVQYK